MAENREKIPNLQNDDESLQKTGKQQTGKQQQQTGVKPGQKDQAGEKNIGGLEGQNEGQQQNVKPVQTPEEQIETKKDKKVA